MNDRPVPNFSLPACPMCSAASSLVASVYAPFWKYAHATSQKRNRNCYILTGCKHAEEVAKSPQIYDHPDDWAMIEATWASTAAKLFAKKTATWTEAQRETFRARLAGRPFLPGATDPLPLTPAEPAQPTNEPTKENDNASES